jgi:hypothetical protein
MASTACPILRLPSSLSRLPLYTRSPRRLPPLFSTLLRNPGPRIPQGHRTIKHRSARL